MIQVVVVPMSDPDIQWFMLLPAVPRVGELLLAEGELYTVKAVIWENGKAPMIQISSMG